MSASDTATLMRVPSISRTRVYALFARSKLPDAAHDEPSSVRASVFMAVFFKTIVACSRACSGAPDSEAFSP